MGSPEKRLTVPVELDGARLDYVIARLGGLSRSRAKRLIENDRAGRVPIPGGGKLSRKRPVRAGETIWFFPEERGGTILPEKVPLEVLFEDDYLAVVNKPAGMIAHPGAGNQLGTLVSALLNRWPQVEGVGEYPRWGIVHRLDKDTSGAIVVALRTEAHRGLTAALADRAVTRQYLALVHGVFSAGTGTIDAPIDRRGVRRFPGPAGKPAVTHYRRSASWHRPSLTLLEVTLETGRTHQIRVHMESIRRPIVGDPVYGRPARSGVDPGRVWLHARRLRFSHPLTGTEIVVSAPLPPDLCAGLDLLGAPSLGRLPSDIRSSTVLHCPDSSCPGHTEVKKGHVKPTFSGASRPSPFG